MRKYREIVKRQLEYWHYQVAHYGPDHPRYRPTKIAKYEHLIREFTELDGFLESLPDQETVVEKITPERPYIGVFPLPSRHASAPSPAPAPAPAPAPPSADVPDDLADLPQELLNELSESAKGETDPLIKIINGRGGTATLDEILIDLYRKYKEIGKRPIVSNKLYRLSRRGLCWPLPGKKGIYTTTKPTGGDGTPPVEDDEGPATGTPETSSNKSEPATKSAQSASSKTRRDLYASTAIPTGRVPH